MILAVQILSPSRLPCEVQLFRRQTLMSSPCYVMHCHAVSPCPPPEKTQMQMDLHPCYCGDSFKCAIIWLMSYFDMGKLLQCGYMGIPILPTSCQQHQSTSFLITEPLMATPSPNQPETTSRVTLQPPLHLCPETKTEMTQAEVSSHFLNICTEEVVPMFAFPTPLDDPKFHEGQRCLTAVASVILGGYDDFSFEVPGAWNYHGSKISYASSYGMLWFLFLDWNSKNIAIQQLRIAHHVKITEVCLWNAVVITSKMMPLNFMEPSQLPRFWCTWMAILFESTQIDSVQ